MEQSLFENENGNFAKPVLGVVLCNLSNYKINPDGKIFSLIKKRYLRGMNNNGYLQYYLKNDDGVSKWYYSHRIMAQTFIPNCLNKPWVNHKDGNKMNNRVENLEWSTISENIQHMWKTGLGSSDKIRKSMIGKRASIGTKLKMSIKRKEYWNNKRLLKNNA